MKLEFLTNQIKFDIEIWNLIQIQVKFWHFDLKFDSSSNFLACQKLELDSNSNSSRNFRLANRIKSTHSSLKLDSTISLRKVIEFILFFSRLLTDAKTRYWLIELEFADIVWVLKKIRHLVDFSEQRFTIIFTNHDATLGIVKQISMTTIFTDKLNFRLVRVSDYIQRFDVELRHKSGKQHIVPDALSRLASSNTGVAGWITRRWSRVVWGFVRQ